MVSLSTWAKTRPLNSMKYLPWKTRVAKPLINAPKALPKKMSLKARPYNSNATKNSVARVKRTTPAMRLNRGSMR